MIIIVPLVESLCSLPLSLSLSLSLSLALSLSLSLSHRKMVDKKAFSEFIKCGAFVRAPLGFLLLRNWIARPDACFTASLPFHIVSCDQRTSEFIDTGGRLMSCWLPHCSLYDRCADGQHGVTEYLHLTPERTALHPRHYSIIVQGTQPLSTKFAGDRVSSPVL